MLFLFLWWITWPTSGAGAVAYWRPALVAALCIAFGYHLVWAAQVYRFDATETYSPDRDGAVLLRRYLDQGWPVVVAVPAWSATSSLSPFYVVGLQPYFSS